MAAHSGMNSGIQEVSNLVVEIDRKGFRWKAGDRLPRYLRGWSRKLVPRAQR